MTAFRLTFNRNGELVIEEDLGGVHPDEREAGDIDWCRACDAAEWVEMLLAPRARIGCFT